MQFSYVMKTMFIEEIVEHSFSLKCVPQSDASQRIHKLDFYLLPQTGLSKTWDAFGNQMLYGRLSEAHDLFVVQVSGEVETTGKPIPQEDETGTWVYKYATRETASGDRIQHFLEQQKSKILERQTALEQAEFLMHAVYQKMHYQKAVTGMSTTAEETFTIGKGVCQDYAHILLALLRQMSIPARYVVGMMEGEGASHAWVEVYEKGFWYGFDPTNDQRVNDSYIRISQGRDAQDCLVERGIFHGNGSQQKLVGVKVAEKAN